MGVAAAGTLYGFQGTIIRKTPGAVQSYSAVLAATQSVPRAGGKGRMLTESFSFRRRAARQKRAHILYNEYDSCRLNAELCFLYSAGWFEMKTH